MSSSASVDSDAVSDDSEEDDDVENSDTFIMESRDEDTETAARLMLNGWNSSLTIRSWR